MSLQRKTFYLPFSDAKDPDKRDSFDKEVNTFCREKDVVSIKDATPPIISSLIRTEDIGTICTVVWRSSGESKK